MKIAIFSQRWITGGKEAFIVNMLKNVDLIDNEVIIVTSYKETSFFDDQLKKLNISVISLIDKKQNVFKRNILLRKQLKVFLSNNYFDKIIFNIDNGWDLNLVNIAKKKGVKSVIAHSHNSDVSHDKFRVIKLLAHRLGKSLYSSSPTDYWACSNKAANFVFNSKIIDQVSIIKNGIDTNKFIFSSLKREEIRRELGVSVDEVLIGTVGRLSEQKNPSFILEIAKNLRLNSQYKFIFVGEGELRTYLQHKALQYGIENNIIFYGNSKDVASMMSAMDIFLLPSKFEGLPITLIEAQTNGLPILVSDKVTDEVMIADNVKFISLDDELLWCEEIKKLKLNEQRTKYINNIRDSGYDIHMTSREYFDLLVK